MGLDLTHNPHDGIDSFEKHQPNKEDTAQQHTELHPGLAQPPEEEKMGPRPDAVDAGNFLRRQIKSPGNFSRSNRKAFLKFEEEMDHKLIYSTIIPSSTKTCKQGNVADTNVENPGHAFWQENPSKKPGVSTTHGNATNPPPNEDHNSHNTAHM